MRQSCKILTMACRQCERYIVPMEFVRVSGFSIFNLVFLLGDFFVIELYAHAPLFITEKGIKKGLIVLIAVFSLMN